VANNKQRDAARRQLEKQLAERQQREAARKRFTLIASIVGTLVLIVAVVVVIAVASGGKKHKTATGAGSDTVSTSPAPSTSAAAPGTCTFTAGGDAARKVTAPTSPVPITGTATVTLTTNRGPITIAMDRAKAPCTVASFVSLVKQKYFDNTHCHRLTTSGIYVLQCGDPTATGSGGPGYTIPDEYTGAEKYTSGVIAMANTGQAHSGGSQFFIVYKDTDLPAQYTVFGTVTSGMDIVDQIVNMPNGGEEGNGGSALTPVIMRSVTIQRP